MFTILPILGVGSGSGFGSGSGLSFVSPANVLATIVATSALIMVFKGLKVLSLYPLMYLFSHRTFTKPLA